MTPARTRTVICAEKHGTTMSVFFRGVCGANNCCAWTVVPPSSDVRVSHWCLSGRGPSFEKGSTRCMWQHNEGVVLLWACCERGFALRGHRPGADALVWVAGELGEGLLASCQHLKVLVWCAFLVMAVLDVSSQTPRSTDIRNKNNYTTWLRALVCAYLPVRVPVRCGGPVLPTAALVPLSPVPPLPRAHGPAIAGSRIASNAVPSCLSPWTPCDNRVAAKEENLRRKPPIERRTGEHREKRATCRRHQVALQANILRSERWQGHRDRKWKAHAPQTAVNERSSMTSAQTTPTQKNDHCARQREQRPSRHRHTSLGVAPPTCPTYP